MRRAGKIMFSVTALAAASGAVASEVITYHYDSRGRLVRTERAGSVNNAINTNYTLDHAGNRATMATGNGLAAPAPPPAPPPPPPPPP